MNIQPTVFHITHHKAGSQWVAEILKQSAPDRVILPKVHVAHFRKDPIKLGGIYLTVYVSREEFETVITPEKWFHQKPYKLLRHPKKYFMNWFIFRIWRKNPFRLFVIIRDLRDTLISLYFSIKNSHPLLTDALSERRKILYTVTKEEGLIYLMDVILKRQAQIQLSWLNNTVLFVTYEELVTDEHAVFERIIDYCQIDVNRQRLHNIIRANSFKVITGRNRGQGDITAHQRKGIVGDWRNHFSAQLKKEFKKRFGDILIKTGYEHDLNW